MERGRDERRFGVEPDPPFVVGVDAQAPVSPDVSPAPVHEKNASDDTTRGRMK